MKLLDGVIDCHIHPTAAKGKGERACADEMLRFADRMGIEWMGTSLGPNFIQQPSLRPHQKSDSRRPVRSRYGSSMEALTTLASTDPPGSG